jgi:hypothetical protein
VLQGSIAERASAAVICLAFSRPQEEIQAHSILVLCPADFCEIQRAGWEENLDCESRKSRG